MARFSATVSMRRPHTAYPAGLEDPKNHRRCRSLVRLQTTFPRWLAISHLRPLDSGERRWKRVDGGSINVTWPAWKGVPIRRRPRPGTRTKDLGAADEAPYSPAGNSGKVQSMDSQSRAQALGNEEIPLCGGTYALVRPISPDDAPALVEFHRQLSGRSHFPVTSQGTLYSVGTRFPASVVRTTR